MYAISGITGKVGGAMARELLAAGKPVRAIVRNPDKSGEWLRLGCELAIADMGDETALTKAFSGVDGVFILPPSNFDPLPGFPEAHAEAAIIRNALHSAKPDRIVCVSTIGGQATQSNLLSQRTILEQALSTLSIPLTILRPAWFLDNLAWDVASAREAGVIHSFLQPADRTFPMISTADVGRFAAELIQESWTGRRIVEIEGPERVSPVDIANAMSQVLSQPVRVEIVPRETWEAMFRTQGMRNPMPRIQMLDGFNEGWIRFENPKNEILHGTVDVRDVIGDLVGRRG
ncbi:NAD(P)H-binding protein [Phyllobacterium sp. OV277]|jgi:uncharacterized protein YbjT (DUF2867 family)|uniref:NmrA family NAD(P)-binding protein n=1 Tax=Phyllobacterium sp. OV277 TaxID=1882772 RepID=UPI0008803145|nr:NAD(P)H-binding protein [Phyllobacterium sp. OV277]SDP66223.1 Uncharacterized conserved protein YbjT, contains NAD(P)-binding and DUF2867 domains [Phyllobacterium sp. OV277]